MNPDLKHLIRRDIAEYLMSKCDMSEPKAWAHADKLLDTPPPPKCDGS